MAVAVLIDATLVRGVLLRPLPYRPGGEVVVLGEEKPCCKFAPTAPANLLDYQRSSRSFEQLAGAHVSSPPREIIEI